MTKFKLKKAIEVDVNAIQPNPWNVNKTTQRQQEAIEESLTYYGQVLDILVRPHPQEKGKYQIIDGEHRFLALKDKAEKVTVSVIEAPDGEAKKLSVILNETRGQADKVELAQLLSSLSEEMDTGLITGLPYTPEELEQMLHAGEFDWDTFENESENEDWGDEDSSTDEDDDDGTATFEVTMPKESYHQLLKMTDFPANEPEAIGKLIVSLLPN